jgi:hypothetical protein
MQQLTPLCFNTVTASGCYCLTADYYLHMNMYLPMYISYTVFTHVHQQVAGGLTAGASLKINVGRECVEEASVPPGLVARLLPVGQVR